jgi:methionyl-tRNA formyltransferase
VFFGTPELAVAPLDAVAAEHTVTAVVCQPDRPQGRSSTPVPPPTKVWALDHGVEVAQPLKLNDGSFEAWLKEQAPDVCVLTAYGRLLKQPILDVPKHGFINVHPSLLPRHRGPSPIQTSILCGDGVTGVSIMRLDAGMDTGDILIQEQTPILPDDTTASLSERLGLLGAELLARGLRLIASGEAVFAPQDHAKASVTRLYSKQDGQIRWSAPARDIHNLVRAAIPWPVAHCLYRDARSGGSHVVRIHKAHVVEEACAGEGVTPGTIVAVERDRLVVATGQGLLDITEVQMPGKRMMSVAEHLRGHAVAQGDRFEDIA